MGQHPPQKLYKYVGEKSALLILGSGQIQFSVPSLFNDDFDCNFFSQGIDNAENYCIKLVNTISKIAFEDLNSSIFIDDVISIAGFFRSITPKDFAPSLNFWEDLVFGDDSNELRDSFQRFIERTVKEISDTAVRALSESKLLCLSETPVSAPMWAHYSENLQGAVLEFDTVHPSDNFFLTARPINYISQPPHFFDDDEFIEVTTIKNGLDQNKKEKILNSIIFGKHISWEYEKEWRILAGSTNESEKRSLVPFHHLALTGVIFGSRSNTSFEQTVKNLIPYYPNCRTYKLKRPDMKAFEYQVVEYP